MGFVSCPPAPVDADDSPRYRVPLAAPTLGFTSRIQVAWSSP